MERTEIRKLYGFYENELIRNFLGFWLPRCEDKEYGGFLNCFDNRGDHLVSCDKYAWSQGRFVWLFSRLAATPVPVFSSEERKAFLRLANQGSRFLMEHCLMGKDDWRVVFLMDRAGTPKSVTPGAPYDMSIYADCFVVIGLGMYAFAADDQAAYAFAKRLYESCIERVQSGQFRTLPYPLSSRFRAHGIPMILNNVSRELLRAAQKLDPAYCDTLRSNMEGFAGDVLEHFTDGDHVVHEIISCDNQFIPQVLGQHMNPGHTIEDTWFLLDAADLCGREEWKKDIFAVAGQALKNGWDSEYGGILHFSGTQGGMPQGDQTGVEEEPMNQQLSGWGDKLWWVHSEALYSTLRCYFESQDENFLKWHERVFDYVFATFPNADPEVREWIQIRTREGGPQEKVVALPVKDPFHIGRNLILILELLWAQLEKSS